MRFILHSDLNNFYASVECLYNPSIRNLCVAVVGDEEKRHGIILSKNNVAKKYGIKTGETIYEAKLKLPYGQRLITIPANFERYKKISMFVKSIYKRYSDRVESFGIDEAWIDISESVKTFDESMAIAEKIRKDVLTETGLTVSIGVSYNKVFAKIGSDYKKPNAVTLITDTNYKEIVWPLDIENLIYVGRATKQKLNKVGIKTIGELANLKKEYLKVLLGKNGETLYIFANGLDDSIVKKENPREKSIGNSVTCPRDLKNIQEIETVLYILAENVASRLRKKDYWCQEVGLFVKDSTMKSFERQIKLCYATNLASDIAKSCLVLFKENYNWEYNVRALGVRAGKICDQPLQYNIFINEDTIYKKGKLEEIVEFIRFKHGYKTIRRANVLTSLDFLEINPTDTRHSINPISFFK